MSAVLIQPQFSVPANVPSSKGVVQFSNIINEKQGVDSLSEGFSGVFDGLLGGDSTSDTGVQSLPNTAAVLASGGIALGEGAPAADEVTILPLHGNILPIAAELPDKSILSGLENPLQDTLHPDSNIESEHSAEKSIELFVNFSGDGTLSKQLQPYNIANTPSGSRQPVLPQAQSGGLIMPGSDNIVADMEKNDIPDPLVTQQGISDAGKQRLTSPVITFDLFSRQLQQNRLFDKGSDRVESNRITTDTGQSDLGLGHQNILETRNGSQLTLSQPVTSHQWGNDFSDRVRWLISNNIQKAELTLNPRNMGTIEISISLNNDQTSIHIVTQHAASKDAVEGSLVRLREILEDSGVNLADVDVSQHSEQESTSDKSEDKPYDKNHEMDAATLLSNPALQVTEKLGMIDLYA